MGAGFFGVVICQPMPATCMGLQTHDIPYEAVDQLAKEGSGC